MTSDLTLTLSCMSAGYRRAGQNAKRIETLKRRRIPLWVDTGLNKGENGIKRLSRGIVGNGGNYTKRETDQQVDRSLS